MSGARPSVGSRISLRRQAAGGAHDLVGEVLDVDEVQLSLLPWDRGPVGVPLAEVVAWRPVPPRAVRPSSTPADVERIASRGWPGLETVRLGGWELRAAEGWTRRANSALPEGDPGMPVPDAVRAVETFYAERGLAPVMQLAARRGVSHPLEGHLDELGWRPGDGTTVMVADLRHTVTSSAATARWRTVPDAGWLAVQGRAHRAQAAVLTASPAEFLTVDGEPDGRPAAIARLATTGDWVGVSCVWVEPGQRGRGLGTAVMNACVHRGLEVGARFGYLQVEQANAGAHRLYQRLGWSDHHDYHYWTAAAGRSAQGLTTA